MNCPKYLYGKLSQETQGLLARPGGQPGACAARWRGISTASWTGRRFIRRSVSRSIKLPPLIQKAVQTNADCRARTVRLNRRMLEEAYPEEIVKSLGGVYPDTEIHTADVR